MAFPDDDCLYAPDLLARVAARFMVDPRLDGLSGRPADRDGHMVGRWPDRAQPITPETVWHTATSHTIFLRQDVVARVGAFDEALGLGSGTPWSSGEEIDYLVRALQVGARIEYDPSIAITQRLLLAHRVADARSSRRGNAHVGHPLGLHEDAVLRGGPHRARARSRCGQAGCAEARLTAPLEYERLEVVPAVVPEHSSVPLQTPKLGMLALTRPLLRHGVEARPNERLF